MSLTPAYDRIEAEKRRETVELCGKNRGPHDYIPIEMIKTGSSERVTRMMCRVCFAHVSVAMLIEHHPEVKY